MPPPPSTGLTHKNHTGELGGGHYTAYCSSIDFEPGVHLEDENEGLHEDTMKLEVDQGAQSIVPLSPYTRQRKWYKLNDSTASPLDTHEVTTTDGYLLFYAMSKSLEEQSITLNNLVKSRIPKDAVQNESQEPNNNHHHAITCKSETPNQHKRKRGNSPTHSPKRPRVEEPDLASSLFICEICGIPTRDFDELSDHFRSAHGPDGSSVLGLT